MSRNHCKSCPYREWIIGHDIPKSKYKSKCEKRLNEEGYGKMVRKLIKDCKVDDDFPIPKSCPLHKVKLK
jgi:hypothetical protein